MKQFRSLFLSDIHLGGGRCDADRLMAALSKVDYDHLYLLGDVLDLEALAAGSRWRTKDTNVLVLLLARAARERNVTFVPGNHDAPIRMLCGQQIAHIKIEQEVAYECVDGSNLLLFHGDVLDREVRTGGLIRVGAQLHDVIVSLDHNFNRLHRRLGGNHRGLMISLKQWISPARRYIRRFEQHAVRYASSRGFDGCVCGHIHYGNMFDANGTRYLNDGDWVEHLTLLGERHDGVWELWKYDGTFRLLKSLPARSDMVHPVEIELSPAPKAA